MTLFSALDNGRYAIYRCPLIIKTGVQRYMLAQLTSILFVDFETKSSLVRQSFSTSSLTKLFQNSLNIFDGETASPAHIFVFD